MFLRFQEDRRHHPDRFHRVGADRRLAGEHDRVRTVEHRVGDIRGLRPGGLRIDDHGFQHLGGGDHQFRFLVGGLNDLLLDHRHVLQRGLHAQVAARDHHPVGGFQDRIQLFDRLAPFQFGDQRHSGFGGVDPADELAHLDHILRFAHKGDRHRIHFLLQAEFQIIPVLLGKRRNR